MPLKSFEKLSQKNYETWGEKVLREAAGICGTIKLGKTTFWFV